MTSSWRHLMGFVTDPMSSLISSFVKIGWEIAKLLRSQAKNGPFSPEISELWPLWWRHHDVIKWGFSVTPCHHWYQVSWRSDDKRSSYNPYKPRMGYFRLKSVRRDTRDDVIMTSLNKVRHWPHCIIHIKFGEDRMRNGQVITLTCYEWAIFTGNQRAVAPVMTSSWRD